MNEQSIDCPEMPLIGSSVTAKIFNIFVCPSLVFDEVVASAPRAINWLVPMLLVCVSTLFMIEATAAPERTAAAIAQIAQQGKVTQAQAAAMGAHWQGVSRLTGCLAVAAGTFWSALAIWLIGRFALKRSFAFRKALEVASLSSTILVLAGLVTGLLALAVGDVSARPALSLFCSKLSPDSPLIAIGEVFNVFHLWAAGVLAIGLARLSAVSTTESVFWVFGFWIFARIVVLVLA